MKRRWKSLSVIAVLLIIAAALCGCSKPAGPADADALKVIQTTIEDGPKGKDFKPPVVILEKGQKLPSGDWPVKVEYTIANPDGSTKKEVATFNLTPIVDSMGANTWTAAEVK